ncbi:MAG: DUF4129 domain-containing protein, partial [Cyclobacteriaceae bacterium]
RILIAGIALYFVGRWYGQKALGWVEGNLGELPAIYRWTEKAVDKGGSIALVLMPGSNVVCLLLGHKHMSIKRFIPLLSIGIVIKLVVLRLGGDQFEDQIRSFPTPIIADEIHIHKKEVEKKKENAGKKPTAVQEKKMTWQEIAWLAAKGLGILFVLILILPILYLIYRMARIAFATGTTRKADQIYRAALYRFHMAGFERETETPLEYAQQKIDPATQAGFAEFMRMYLRLKYSNGTLREGDESTIRSFQSSIGNSIRKSVGIFRAAINYFNIFRALRYFQQPEINSENSSL